MVTVAVRNQVADYDSWKVVFDEHETVRKQHGTTGATVLSGADLLAEPGRRPRLP
jgi:hypothetical protein